MTGLIRGMTGKSTFELRWKASSYNYLVTVIVLVSVSVVEIVLIE